MGGKTLLLDVTVTHALRQDRLKSAAADIGVGSDVGEGRKLGHYARCIPDQTDFLPLVAETLGGWGEAALAFLNATN